MFSIRLGFLAVSAALLMPLAGFADSNSRPAPANEQGQYRYLIEFEEPGLLHATTRARGERFDAHSPEVVAHRARLKQQHVNHRQAIAAALDRGPRITHYYLATHSGMAIWLSPAEADKVRAMDGVVSVERERIYELATYRGPWFIGADSIWDGSAVPGGTGTRGEGMVVAVLDTGIDPDHPSFANDTACGHGQDGAPDKLLSHVDCASTDDDGMCNGPAPFDTNSHGSHVASTAAGNLLDQDTDPPPGEFERISGVAPCAHIRMYKVCPDLSCPGALIQAGMDSVLLDGDVHVMNFSISGGDSPWTDNDRRKLDLVGAGVLVAAAGGNTGVADEETVGQVNHKGPWVLTVAASTHDGGDVALPTVSASGPGEPPEETQRLVLTKPSVDDTGEVPDAEPFTDKPIRRAVDDAAQVNDEGCTPYSAGYYDGAVALIQRGTCQFGTKVQLAQAAGADVIIIRNNEPGALVGWTIAATPEVPVYGMAMADGEAMAEFIGGHVGEATVDFEFVAGQGMGDVLAGFSLRGPTPAPLQDLTKPDIAAPGVSIFAAEPGVPGLLPGGYGFKSGTSMASPHAAGAAALVRAAHPDWTVSEVKSAMMMTATNDGGTRPDETTPWDPDDVGGGRVDLTKTALAGLVMDETFDNYLAADPAEGGDLKTLNLPAVRSMDCFGACTFTRTVRNTLGEAANWTATGAGAGFTVEIEPASFSFSGDTSETQDLTITVAPMEPLLDIVAFGEVVLSEDGGLSPDQHFTVAIMGVPDGVFRDRFELLTE